MPTNDTQPPDDYEAETAKREFEGKSRSELRERLKGLFVALEDGIRAHEAEEAGLYDAEPEE